MHIPGLLFIILCTQIGMIANQVTDELSSLDMPQALLDLLMENSFDRERLLKMRIDDLAIILSIDIEAAKNYNKFGNELLQFDVSRYERA
jgi:hypothetical protein